MLRQVFLYAKNEIIFSYIFAQAYDNDTIDLVFKKKLVTLLSSSADTQIFNKPLLDYQAHYGILHGVLYLYVSDLADRPKLMEKEIQRAASLFAKLFSDPLKIKSPSPQREEFTNFIRETHYYLHPKITLMGPLGGGKSTIVNLLRRSAISDKKIMNFAEYFQIQIGELFLDLWDFIEKEPYSPLWNNYIRGSDIILFVLSGSAANLEDRQVTFYFNLKTRECKYSRMAVILTNTDAPDYITASGFIEKYPQFKDLPIFEIDLSSEDAKEGLEQALSQTIGVKRPLPSGFKQRVVDANNLIGKEEYEAAIEILKDLSQICQEYQEIGYYDIFHNKLAELEIKLKEKREREELEQSKIKAPEKVKFDSFKGVQALPTTGKLQLPTLSSIKSSFGPKAEDEQVFLREKEEESLQSATMEQETPELLAGIDKKNPFFTGLTPIQESSLHLPAPPPKEPIKMPLPEPVTAFFEATEFNEPLQQMKPGAPIEDFEIKSRYSKPIPMNDQIASPLHGKVDQVHYNPMEKPFVKKAGETREKTLTLAKSPLVSDSHPSSVTDKKKSLVTVPSTPMNDNLAIFSHPFKQEAQQLATLIASMGESLSLELCEQFIGQLKSKLNRTQLSEKDLKKAAEMFVQQRQKHN